MASGKNNNADKAQKAQQSAVKSLQPQNYSDPFGSLKKGIFTPILPQALQSSLDNFTNVTGALSGQLNRPFDINDYYNNPFYATASEQYKAPVLRQYQQDQNELANNLNARNQMGSSYDALMNRNLMQQRDFQLNQADDQARTASASAYQQQHQSLINSLTTALGGKSTLLDQIYAPAKIALNYQGALSPLQQAQANVYNTTQAAYLPNGRTGGGLGGLASGALSGATTGASFGPWGALAGAGLGAAGGLLGGR